MFGENKTVVRGGYGRIYGRLNGVNLLLVPLLPPGLLQAVSCIGANKSGVGLWVKTARPFTVYRPEK